MEAGRADLTGKLLGVCGKKRPNCTLNPAGHSIRGVGKTAPFTNIANDRLTNNPSTTMTGKPAHKRFKTRNGTANAIARPASNKGRAGRITLFSKLFRPTAGSIFSPNNNH